MALEKRQYIRFSIDIPAIRFTKYGEAVNTILHQISVGGCLAEWDESVLVGDIFRILIPLPNQNFLPLECKALYRFVDNGIGVKFMDINQFEQELVSEVIAQSLADQGLPMQIDVFGVPTSYKKSQIPQITDERVASDAILEDILN